jgi:pimeloyl-ACP methyl ester carboxylesterase
MRLLLIVFGVLLFIACVLAAAIGLGGPAQLPPLRNANDPYRSLERGGLPAELTAPARDGTAITYRKYAAAPASDRHESVVLVHGSSARGESMHALAQGFAQAGYDTYAIDVRGHGTTGTKGQVAYIGQLEDDLEDFVKAVPVKEPRSLVGFSAGGGFALRFAADRRAALFDHYLLLSPFLGPDASTYRPDSGGWTSVGLPRVVGLVILNKLGINAFNDLPVNRFALGPEAAKVITAQYSYALWSNFRPHREYRADMAASGARSVALVVGQNDEQFRPERFAPEFESAGHAIPVTVVPGTGHVGLTLTPVGVAAVVNALGRLEGEKK